MTLQTKQDINFMDDQQFAEMFCDYLESKEWWIILQPCSNTLASGYITLIETKYYKPGTKANDDFHFP